MPPGRHLALNLKVDRDFPGVTVGTLVLVPSSVIAWHAASPASPTSREVKDLDGHPMMGIPDIPHLRVFTFERHVSKCYRFQAGKANR